MDRQFDELTTTEVGRRDLLVKTLAGAALGAGAMIVPQLARADGGGSGNTQEAEIHDLQAAFHLAKSTQDIDLMMSLWAEEAVFGAFVGNDAIRALFLTTGSFTNRRLSLAPSFKTKIDVDGRQAFLYFECIDIGDFDLPSRYIAGASFIAGTVRKIRGKWLFWRMNAGSASPLSVDHYYFP